MTYPSVRYFGALCVLMLLSGCWVSDLPLISADKASYFVEPGNYRKCVGKGDDNCPNVSISKDDDNGYTYDDKDDLGMGQLSKVRFLEITKDVAIAQQCRTDEKDMLCKYLLVSRIKDGEYVADTIKECGEEECVVKELDEIASAVNKPVDNTMTAKFKKQ